MKKILLIIIFSMISIGGIMSQNKQILYGFDEIPQTLLLNPGAVTNYKYHAGVPLLSGISTNASVSGFTIADLFRADNVNFNTKLDNVLNQLGTSDYVAINTQVEVINAGYKINERDYLSVGYYTELDAFFTIPKDFLQLIKDGNAGFINRNFLFSSVNVKADLLGVIHAGISRKMSEKLTIGGRVKLYSGALNVLSNNNRGSFTTRLGTDNIYVHTLSNVGVSAYSSGFYDANNEINLDARDIIGSTFLGSNLGLGFDIGVTYRIDPQTVFTASLLDIGFISYSEKTRNGTVNGNYTFSGIEFLYDSTNPDYWQQLNDDIDANILRENNRESYSVMRPIKFNAALQYQFGRTRSEESCSDISYKNYYDNAVGAQLYTIIRPIGPRFAMTGFYQRRISEKFNTKVTYTIDDFSYTNFGIGVSANVWKLNIYGVVDNVFQLSDIANANNASFQLGINMIFK
ncbi:DUF5723 family protein [Tenacibaculum amylolyticum]|uniref:DUF5723 family protein n=1 Tax=Tenacibaculum amylolyticum TaxID=104269 RepID=UPI0038962F8C